MKINHNSAATFGVDSIPWTVFFIISIWLIWKSHNDVVFNFEASRPLITSSRYNVWSRYLCISNAIVPTTQPAATPSPYPWHPASLRWVSLNTCGVVSSFQAVSLANDLDAASSSYSLV
ncbi:hypothetical protein V6N13_108349 [Hibiscus sabdariffa]